MRITKLSNFLVTLTSDDQRTGYKKGAILRPKGVYWHRKCVVLMGDKQSGHIGRLAFPHDIVQVDVINPKN